MRGMWMFTCIMNHTFEDLLKPFNSQKTYLQYTNKNYVNPYSRYHQFRAYVNIQNDSE